MKFLNLLIPLLLFTTSANSDDLEMRVLFEQKRAIGTMVISSLDGQVVYVHNSQRATTLFSAASTFKIPNSLIALEERVIKNSDSVIEWDGTRYEYESWNSNQTLKSAYRISCVWCYQKFAKEIGSDKYNDYLSKIGFGTLAKNFNTTTFWLDNGLVITANEQIDFLKRLYHRELPFSDNTFEVVREIMIEKASPSYTLRAKTGWAARVTPQVGWYVGYVENNRGVWFFATNLEIRNKNDLPLRKQLTIEALRIKGILDGA